MTLKIFSCLSMSTIKRRCVAVKAVCVHVHVSDNRGSLCDTENSWLLVDIDKRETLRDDKSGLRAYGEERKSSPPQHPWNREVSVRDSAIVTEEH